MARTETLENLITQVRDRAEVREVYISDTTMTTMINQSIADLYNLLVRACPDRYYDTDDVSIVSGTDLYDLPADFYKLLGADYLKADDTRYTLRRFSFAERNRFSNTSLVSIVESPEAYTRYRIIGDEILFIPKPTWSGTVRLWYIPAPAKLVASPGTPNTFDGISGYEEWVVLDVCIKCLGKEESDPTPFMAKKKEIEKTIESLALERDAGEPDKVRDIDTERYWDLVDGF